MNETDLDVEEIRLSLSKQVFNITDTSSAYSNEWKTTECMMKTFSSIQEIVSNYENSKGFLLNHLNDLDRISKEIINKMNNLVNNLTKDLININNHRE